MVASSSVLFAPVRNSCAHVFAEDRMDSEVHRQEVPARFHQSRVPIFEAQANRVGLENEGSSRNVALGDVEIVHAFGVALLSTTSRRSAKPAHEPPVASCSTRRPDVEHVGADLCWGVVPRGGGRHSRWSPAIQLDTPDVRRPAPGVAPFFGFAVQRTRRKRAAVRCISVCGNTPDSNLIRLSRSLREMRSNGPKMSGSGLRLRNARRGVSDHRGGGPS